MQKNIYICLLIYVLFDIVFYVKIDLAGSRKIDIMYHCTDVDGNTLKYTKNIPNFL